MYIASKLLWTLGLVLGVWAQQIRLQQPYEEWPLTSDLVVRDTLQGYYENMVDDVIGGYNEQLLVWLVHSMNTVQLNTIIKTQASLLGLDHASGACLMKMPGIIAKHVNRISNIVLSTIDPTVDHFLPVLGPRDATTEELETAFTSLNQVVGHHLLQSIDNYDLLMQVTQDMETCEEQYEDEDDDMDSDAASLDLLTDSDIWSWLSHRLPGFLFQKKHPQPPLETAFLDDYLTTIKDQIWVELDARVPDLITTIQADLLEDDF
ncbi:hypothetical protein DFQ28_009262 [Apophysomyces sp. BC1034]|nr:hypothetical protein DFQ30_009007 [Apophysomyces sp. BC1015]KAG0173358.1 hypothetical protein DFQ29_007977 [Apophysomyces sp. BC1021]KAG0185480.1 hypothetical protein DFQ28_009262 [Apophysomyces sp. BC1034]